MQIKCKGFYDYYERREIDYLAKVLYNKTVNCTKEKSKKKIIGFHYIRLKQLEVMILID